MNVARGAHSAISSCARETTSNVAGSGIYINGNRDNQKNITVDGIVATDTHSNGSLSFQPNMDALAEVKILTSNYQAEYGRNSGGAVTAIIKSGTREFHGSGYEFFRNDALNANDTLSNRAGLPRGTVRHNQFGGTLGGPIWKDKHFFFVNAEFLRNLEASETRTSSVPTTGPGLSGEKVPPAPRSISPVLAAGSELLAGGIRFTGKANAC